MNPATTNHKKKTPLSITLLKIVFVLFFIIGIAGVLFIKFDTPAAAEFTDNYLRPIIGDQNVIALEKIYFNISDSAEHITYHQDGTSDIPLYDSEGGDPKNLPNSPLNLTPIPITHNFTPEKNEGVWQNKPLKLFPGQEVAAYTYIRPDVDRAYAYVTVVQLDMGAMTLGAVAGKKQPGGPVGNPGPGVIPQDIIDSNELVAAFDGGFQYRDGEYGMIVDGVTYLPLKNDVGTLIGYKSGALRIINYQGQDLGKDVAFVRQNCPILIENGQVYSQNEQNKKLWGRTFTSGIFTWRSGMGLTKEGHLLYAAGNNLTPISLAYALKAAGAVSAIQLDINPFWVRFNFFEPLGDGRYSSSTLMKKLADGSKEYLNGYSKDFFYVYKKQSKTF